MKLEVNCQEYILKVMKSYQLVETGIIETKSKTDSNSFCFIKIQLFEKGKLGNKRLEGNFTASLKNDSICTKERYH
ncbi:MAG: hypothetical protein CM15mP112_02070 [Flavobacteriales bacterium]|nr:MAG: hypothetical protein CM15mP112_02070 [Flavobacteriales bacterium]